MDSQIELLKTTEVANLLKVTKMTLRRWDKKGIIKPVIINTRNKCYKKIDIEKLIEARGK